MDKRRLKARDKKKVNRSGGTEKGGNENANRREKKEKNSRERRRYGMGRRGGFTF